jgi:alpha-tubulin suppressor-like RCC1 family protein
MSAGTARSSTGGGAQAAAAAEATRQEDGVTRESAVERGGAPPHTGPCAFVWGYNGTGGLGIGSAATVLRPTPVRLPAGTVSLAVGTDYGLAVTSKGELWAWGGNEYGQLGDGTTASRLRPGRVKLPSGARVVGAAAAQYHTLVVTDAGHVYGWGRNHFGQLGDGTRTDRHLPARIPVSGRVTQVSTGRDHSAAITDDGAAYAWGINNAGQLGDGTRANRFAPVRVQLPIGVRLAAIDAGNDHTLGLTTAGRVAVWGNPIVAAAAENPALRRTEPLTTPVVLHPRLFGGSRVVAVDGGDNHATALTRDGRVWIWGRNSHGQLGDGTAQDHRVPGLLKLAGRVQAVRSAGNLLLAQTSTGELYAWGENRFGQIGDGTMATRGRPTRVKALRGAKVKDVAAGAHSVIVIVDHGPPTGLRLEPHAARVRPSERVTFSARLRDAFGHDLGAHAFVVALRISDGNVKGMTAWSAKPGRHYVTASAGAYTGRALLEVTDADAHIPPPAGHRPHPKPLNPFARRRRS